VALAKNEKTAEIIWTRLLRIAQVQMGLLIEHSQTCQYEKGISIALVRIIIFSNKGHDLMGPKFILQLCEKCNADAANRPAKFSVKGLVSRMKIHLAGCYIFP
jgi:hypothetical protein